MAFHIRATNLRRRLEPSPDANQKQPRKHYVYAHTDDSGQYFYIGKGVGRRAWSEDRHSLWHRYVEKHLSGSYQVLILQDNLTAEEAEEAEFVWMEQHSDTLVNWVNMGRDVDLEAVHRYHKLRDANRALIARAKELEKIDLPRAAQMYEHAIAMTREYAFIQYDKGLIGRLLAEEAEETGRYGELEALDRLTLCLIKLGEVRKAARITKEYFATYRGDTTRTMAERITKRVDKAVAREDKGALPS